ncbi:proteasome activator subunit [Thecamonas trahens ATCC 50062]|uniref:Proteasome activator subunit n=1 Tax=Thecamonas trahens ATCC 50062 TaxID=461836 RepID=A0A0L0DHX2_THETB|nr:proteasome activator subunit [Thecamonas trahens ATCC 50062]KNC51825.1 proteasome activator subunit [Thecamonas trahens ATCC 50062]|eukprot:XP_013755690.1 proteasome activator subunit [Thecamonas trahens ATCC 50062]
MSVVLKGGRIRILSKEEKAARRAARKGKKGKKKAGRGGKAGARPMMGPKDVDVDALAFMESLRATVAAEASKVITEVIPAKISEMAELVSSSQYDAPNWAEYRKANLDMVTSSGNLFAGTLGTTGAAQDALKSPLPRFMAASPRVQPFGTFPSVTATPSASPSRRPSLVRTASASKGSPHPPHGHVTGMTSASRAGSPCSGSGSGSGSGSDACSAGSSDSSASSDSSSLEFSGPKMPAAWRASDAEAAQVTADMLGLDGKWSDAEALKALRVRVNSVILPLSDKIKHEMYVFLDTVATIKNWIQLRVPSSTDRVKQFDVAVQITVLTEVMGYEATVVAQLRSIHRYFQSRGALVARVLRRPWNADLINSIIDLDDRYFSNLWVSFSLLLSAYRALHDSLQKNMPKILSGSELEPRVGAV